MDNNMDDINRDTLDNLLTVADNNDDNGNNDISINTLLQQLLLTTTSLKAKSTTMMYMKMTIMTKPWTLYVCLLALSITTMEAKVAYH